jgi:hypothetical protein
MVGVSTSTGCRADQLIWVLAIYPPISSPPPTPSLGPGGTSSQVDELFPPSPPAGLGDGVSILELESLKMGKSTFSIFLRLV